MTMLPPFRLSVAPCTACTIETTTGLGAPPRDSEVQVQNKSVPTEDAHNEPVIEETPATSERKGSFNHDRGKGGYGMEWSNIDEFDAWRRSEELANSIELIASGTVRGGALWTRKRIYVCSRQRSGGPSKYQKKHPERHRKLESKKTGCRCRVVIKQYPHTETILGRYTNKHDHEIGEANVAYTRLSRNAREQIKMKLMQNVDPKEIVRAVRDSAPDGSRDRLITLPEVSRMARVTVVEEEIIRTGPLLPADL